MEDYPAQEEGDESTTSQSIAMDQEASHTQSDTPDHLEHEVIVIVTDTESENEQEEGDEEEEEQVERVQCIYLVVRRLYLCAYTSLLIQLYIGLC